MRYNFLPFLAAFAVTAGCASDPVGLPSDPTASFGISGGPTVLTLVDEGGAPLAGQTGAFRDFRYSCGGSWAPWTSYSTDIDGQFTVTPDCTGYAGNWDNKVTVRLNQGTVEQDVTVNPVFQAARVNVNLKSCIGPIIAASGAGGVVHQGTGTWASVGTTGPTGTISFYTFPGNNNQVRMTYNGKQVILVPAIVPGANEVDFLTTKVTLVSGGAIWSNTGGSWWQFAKPSMDLLPGTYNFYNNTNSTASPLVAPLVVSGCELVYPAVSDNAPSVSTAAADALGTEGQTLTTSGAFTGSGLTLTANNNVGTFTPNNAAGTWTWSLATTDDVATATITVTATNGLGQTAMDNFDYGATNVAPTLTVTAPAAGTLYALGIATNLTSTFTDPGSADTHTCTVAWDDGTTAGPSASGVGTCNASRTYTAPGVYTISVTVTDDNGGSDTETVMVIVYDPTAGFVTGGGWINSPAGAYALDTDLTGKATFGFVSKYLKGSSVPTGNTQFQFKAGDLNFSSTSYEWLVVAGARAQFKGAGTINGSGDYRFMLTVIDGQINGGGGTDKFRIRIWNNDGGGLVYDNLLNAPDSDDPSTVLGGGSIVIHVPKK